MKMKQTLLALAILASSATASAAPNLVVNGGFETGNFNDWTHFGNTAFTDVVTTPVNSGAFAAEFGPDDAPGGISQTLATTAGAQYIVSFALQNEGGTPNSFSFSWGDDVLDVVLGSELPDATGFDFPGPFSTFSVTATSGSTLLSFTFQHVPLFWHLDDVVVELAQVAAVPEPSILALLGLGLVAAGVARRRKQ